MTRAALAILRKDLRIELRTRQSVPAMALFSVTGFVLFHFGLDRDTLEGDLAAGVLWVTLLLAAVLGISRLFVAEREEGGFDAFLLAPVDRTAMFVAKACVLAGFLTAVELVAVPAFVILLLGPPPGQALPELLLDEPRANLDPKAAGLLEPLIGRESGRTRVLVTHDVEGGLAESDVVLGLRRGKQAIVGTATVDELRGLYS